MAQTRSQNKTAAKQNDIHSNQKPRVFADKPPSAKEILFGALSQGLCAQTSCPIFLKLDSLPICKGKPYLKLSKLILNWTVRKN